ncbi:MAG: hypothetical protein Q8Q95_00470 [bacterium]|nr:hypothetical protein [bacterium]
MDQQTQTRQSLLVVEFNEINQPGCYITPKGDLVRVVPEGIKAQHSPLITVESKDDTRVTKISDNAFEPIGKARLLAANADLAVNF